MISALEDIKVSNVLEYAPFRYEMSEWDNVPSVIARFQFYLQKYTQGLSAFCNEKNQEEKVASLRADLEKRIEENNNHISEEKEARDQEENRLEKRIEELQAQINSLKQ